MAITIRNEDTLKKLDKLCKETGNSTKTGMIDQLVERSPFLESELKAARNKISALEVELLQVKKVILNKTVADKAYDKLCQNLETE